MSASRVLAHIVGVAWAGLLTAILYYSSRLWTFQAPWGREGLFGVSELRPGGDIIRPLLRGTWASDFDIVIWGAGAIVLLSVLAAIIGRFSRAA